jgi:hypothetical protein
MCNIVDANREFNQFPFTEIGQISPCEQAGFGILVASFVPPKKDNPN